MKTFIAIFLSLLVTINTSYAKDLVLAISIEIAPFAFSDGSGLEPDIVRESLKLLGYSIKTISVPLKDLSKTLDKGIADIAVTIRKDMKLKNVHLSKKSHIFYHNVALSLKKNNFKIESIMDLKDFNVIVFQNADKYIGPEWNQMKKKSTRNITEMAEQSLQVQSLFQEKTDVIVLDMNIFKYIKARLKNVDTNEPVTLHKIIPKNKVYVAFRDHKIRDAFNKGFEMIKKNKTYEKIFWKYLLK